MRLPVLLLIFAFLASLEAAAIENLPTELLLDIAENLPFSDVLKLSQVNKAMYQNILGSVDYFATVRIKSPSFDPWNNEKDHKLGERFPSKYDEYLSQQSSSSDRFLSATEKGSVRLVYHALKQVVGPTDEDNFVFKWALLTNRHEVLNALLNWKGPNGEFFDPTAEDNNAIKVVCEHGHLEVVKMLLNWTGPNEEFVDPRAEDNNALKIAIQKGHNEIVEALLNWKGPNGELVNPTVNNLNWATWNGRIAVFESLLAWKGPDGQFLDATARDNLPIQWACEHGHLEVVKMLLNWTGPNGEFVDPRAEDNNALKIAIQKGHNEIVEAFLNWKGPNGELVSQ